MSFWTELKRRNVIKVAIAYLAAVWLVVQVAAIVIPAFEFPDWTMRGVLALAAVGFLLAVTLAWIYDLTPEGIRRTDDLPVTPGAGLKGRKLDFVIIGLLSLALIAVVFDRYWLDDGSGTIDTFLNEAATDIVSDFPGSHSEPTLSPDGAMIAFVSDASGSRQIWVKNLARGEPIQITDGELEALSPAWSPRNDQILFERQSAGSVPSIYSVGPLGTPEPRMLVERGLSPSFDGEGRRFAFEIAKEIWVADADGSNQHEIEGVPESPGFAARAPSLSPDGSLVAFVHGEIGPFGEIWVIPADGGEALRLTRHSDRAEVAGSPAWTADGRHIVYSAGGVGARHLWRVDVDSGEAKPLTTGTGGYDSPLVSADGGTLAYSSRRSLWRLMRSDTASVIHAPLYESRNPIILPRVSPDGEQVVFFTQIATGLQVFAIEADGRNLRQLTFDEDGMNTLPTWSDTGDDIYYHRWMSLHRIPVAGGPSVEVLPDFHWSSRNWLAVHGDRIAYQEFGIEPGVRRTVIRDLDTGTETALIGPPIVGFDWSRDGNELVGTLPNRNLAICSVQTLECAVLTGPDGPIRGERPLWSTDESRIFFLRGSRAFYRDLWVVDRNGQNLTRLFEFGPVDADDYLTGVARDDAFIWNLTDRGTDEIWVARRR